MNDHYKISLCTVAMNRLHHLSQTLPRNIEDNAGYTNLEHVLLDYNSEDNMEQWVMDNLGTHISSGRLKYYRTTGSQQFQMAHSKNMVAKLAGGNIVCLVDADNYTGKGYAAYVNNCFSKKHDIFLTPIYARKAMRERDVLGRVCFLKEDFLAIQGFDEFMNNYGFDDYDFAYRLEQMGRRRVIIRNHKFLHAISHSQDERAGQQRSALDPGGIFIQHLDPATSEFLYLFADNSYSRGVVRDHSLQSSMRLSDLSGNKKYKYQESLLTDDWQKGAYQKKDGRLLLLQEGREEQFDLSVCGTVLLASGGNSKFLKISNRSLESHLLLFHSIIRNRNKMYVNRRLKKTAVNNGCFGEGSADARTLQTAFRPKLL